MLVVSDTSPLTALLKIGRAGLLGCLLRAKDARLLDAIAPVISDLQEIAGCWFDDALIAGTLRAAGELV